MKNTEELEMKKDDGKEKEILIVKPTSKARGHMQLEAEVDVQYILARERFFSGIFESNGSFYERLHTTDERGLVFYEEELNRGGLKIVATIRLPETEIFELNSFAMRYSRMMYAAKSAKDNYFSRLANVVSRASEGVER